MRFFLSLIAFIITTNTFANVDTINIFSNSMHKNIKCVVVTPKNYKSSNTNYPVVYLLHGYGGDYSNWIKIAPWIDSLADVYKMILVCPDAAKSSWYWDSPIDTSYRYETFTATELPNYIDGNYPTIKNRKARAITGLSMGGHGGIFLGFRHPETFGGCGSMSGALNTDYITNGYDVPKRLGDTITNRHYYSELSAISQLDKFNPKDSLAVIVDCGVQDFIIMMSRQTHEKMLKLKIPHDYIERPGAHERTYWATAIKYQLLFFREYFRRNM